MLGKVKVGRINETISKVSEESPAIMLLSGRDFNGGEPTCENLVGRAKSLCDYLKSQGKKVAIKPFNSGSYPYKLVEIK